MKLDARPANANSSFDGPVAVCCRFARILAGKIAQKKAGADSGGKAFEENVPFKKKWWGVVFFFFEHRFVTITRGSSSRFRTLER